MGLFYLLDINTWYICIMDVMHFIHIITFAYLQAYEKVGNVYLACMY